MLQAYRQDQFSSLWAAAYTYNVPRLTLTIIHKEVGIQVVEPPTQPVLMRAPRTCSMCRSLEHTACTCPERQ